MRTVRGHLLSFAKQPPMDRERIIVVFFFAFLALITYQLYALLSPFLTPIAWAILLAFLAHPALIRLDRAVRNRTVSAIVMTFVVALGVVLPAIWLFAHLMREVQTFYTEISAVSTNSELSRLTQWLDHTRLGARLAKTLARHGLRLEDEIKLIVTRMAKTSSDYVVTHGGAVAGNIASFIFHFSIAVLTFFYLLRDGETYYEGLRELTPLHEEDKAAIFETLRATLSSVMRGLMLTAVLDGIALGLGYLILGVPYWALLAFLTAAAGLLPIGGTAVVWVPVIIYLGFQSSWVLAAVMLGWAALTLIITDNFVKPLAMRHGTGLPTLALFFGLAGGIGVYGPIGIFAGPAVIAIFAALLRVYRRTYVGEGVVMHPEPAQISPRRPRRGRFKRGRQ
jgi:predicted PurR-regulated permease PerM